MKIDGKSIAKSIFEELKERVILLKKNSITAHLVIVLVGDDPSSKAYVRQKELKAQEIGAQSTIYHLPVTTSQETILQMVDKFNKDKNINGIIVQQPLPKQINEKEIILSVYPEKDIDGLHPNSPYPMPLAKAVITILKNVHSQIEKDHFLNWLKRKKIVVIGKGETGGGPTIQALKDLGVKVEVIDSKTKNPEEIIKKADIIVSAVGKKDVIKPSMLKKNVILIGVGLHREEDNKLHGDYNEEEIKDKALFYTPVPGGVGPVNVACLLENLIKATEMLNS